LYGLEGGYVDESDEELCAALRLDERIADAVALVRWWGLESYWREGEEWIGDALTAIVGGGLLGWIIHISPLELTIPVTCV